VTKGGAEAAVFPAAGEGVGPAHERPAGAAGGGPAAKGGTADGRAARGRAATRRTPKRRAREPAATLKVARVAVDISLPHLDRPFDYLVPAELAERAVPGCRVRVRFAGQLVDGFILARVAGSDHEGRLAYLERVTSPEPVLTPEIAALAREVADRCAGTLADVLRLAIPPRHARVEAEVPRVPDGPGTAGDSTTGNSTTGNSTIGDSVARGDSVAAGEGPGPWAAYPAGASFLSALAAGRAPRAVWTALPGPQWAAAIARAARAALAAGRGVVIVAADGRDVGRIDAALAAELGDGRHVALTAELGPAERYRRWLALRRGTVRVAVGTRATMFAPVRDIGLVVLWDDGDDVHAEPHAPYPHAREVLALRAHRAGAGALIGGFSRTTDATRLVESGWARPLVPDRDRLRRVAPRVRPAGDDAELPRDEAARTARLPYVAFRAARQALEDGPVLVQVPRRGYLPALACARCRGPARCAACQGPLAMTSAHAVPYCRWCGRIAGERHCPDCGGERLRATVVGAGRTAEELGRAFPGVPVRASGRDAVLDRVGTEPALVVATPGAEPVADRGYAAALLLDGWALLGRADLRAAEEALRRWMNAAALVRAGEPVIVLADGALRPVQALLRWDPVTHAERELADRRELGFPPAAKMASLTGPAAAVRDLVDVARLPAGAEVLGPVPLRGDEPRVRALVRVPHRDGAALAAALKAAQGVRSARKAADSVRVEIDPLELI
jgi:primosomal protein N' (replication factor Y)